MPPSQPRFLAPLPRWPKVSVKWSLNTVYAVTFTTKLHTCTAIRRETFTVDTGIYYENIKMYTHTYTYTHPYIHSFTGVQASFIATVLFRMVRNYRTTLIR